MKKLGIPGKTLDELIIRDCLCAVGTLDSAPDTKGLYFVVGGVGVQSYLPTSCRRPTSDLDLAILEPLNYEDFKQFSKRVREYLQDSGYEVGYRKNSRAFSLEVTDKDGSCLIEFARNSEESYEKKQKRLERERQHARKKIVEGEDVTYVVSAPEDIVVPKLARSVNSFRRNPLFERDVSQKQKFSDEEVQRQLRKINELKKNAIYNLGDVLVAEELRFASDLYDIRLLSELTGFNEKYLVEAAGDWNSLNKDSNERNLLIRSVLPDLIMEEKLIS